MTEIKVKPSERLVKLKKMEVLKAYDLWQEAPVQTEVNHYYEERLREAVEELFKLLPDYRNKVESTMVSELVFRIKEDLKK